VVEKKRPPTWLDVISVAVMVAIAIAALVAAFYEHKP
jgi:hypothetical protein